MPTTNDTTTTETTTTTTDTTTDTGTETTTVSTTTGTTTTAATGDTTGTTNSTEVVEVDWEQIQPVFEFRQRLVNLRITFSMCQFEKDKANLMNQIVYGQADLYAMAQNLQKELNVNENLTYELKLPATPGEKGYFLRKDN